jgi:hypothetical protein
MPRPDDAPLRVLLLEKTDAATESGKGRTPAQKAALSRLKTEMKKAGVLGSSTTLEPSSKSKRLVFNKNTLRVLDGPFSEAKELIGGFAIVQATSKEHAVELAKRFLRVVGEGESEIRLMHEASAFDASVASRP